MLSFALAVFFLFITPGPGVLSIAGVGAAYGYRKALRYFAGLFVGTNLVAFAVISGLAALMLSVPALRSLFLFGSAGYLLYLAYRIAFSGTEIAFIKAPTAPGFVAGIVLQAINPKAYAVNTTFFSGFAFWPESLVVETMIKLAIMNAIWIPIHVGWLAAGVTVQRLNLAPRTHFVINMIMAFSMLAVVVLATLAQR
ncbi:MAG: LysE family transporter [Hyphomicrobiaceae bacterium]|nr:LysE family transporter [Hyphomicrobiaceae bacterium]